MTKVSIGICAKNEQNTIIRTLNSVVLSIKKLPTNKYTTFLFICLNGSTDQTEELLKKWQHENKDIKHKLIILKKANLVEAQRIIIKKATRLGIKLFSFFDADIILDKNCLINLISNAIESEAQAFYAISKPIETGLKKGYLERALNQYDVSPTTYTPRKHLHGRAFLIKDWHVPKTDPELLVDDIYLSFHLLTKYGTNSIKKVDSAIAYFYQINNIKDLFRVSRRRNIEIHKCLTLFSEFKKLPKDQVNRQFLWKLFLKENFTRKKLWLYLILLQKTVTMMIRADKFINPVNRPQWEEPKSSKVNRKVPFLVLVEGLDCSGKKTTARGIKDELLENGISCHIHMGPLSFNWYNKLSRFVSLHRVPNILRTLVYSFEGLGDKQGIKKFHSDVVLQISSPLRSLAYAIVMEQTFRVKLTSLIAKKSIIFDQTYYITANYKDRLERHSSQVAAGENSDQQKKRFFTETIFNKMDKNLQSLLLKKDKINKIINTSKENKQLFINNITKNILKELNNH